MMLDPTSIIIFYSAGIDSIVNMLENAGSNNPLLVLTFEFVDKVSFYSQKYFYMVK